MRAVDTNVLVRLIARDHRQQTEAAEEFVAKGAWVPHLVLAETVWVLDSVYGLKADRIARAVEMLLSHAQLTLQDADAVEAALASFRRRPTVGFTDNLVVEVARKHGHLPVGTFDRSLGGIAGVQRL